MQVSALGLPVARGSAMLTSGSASKTFHDVGTRVLYTRPTGIEWLLDEMESMLDIEALRCILSRFAYRER